MMGYEWHDLVGNLGVACILGSYLLLQMERLASTDWGYLLLNAAGALLVLISLAYNFNLSAFIIEISWLAISIFGMIRLSLKAS